MTRPHHIDDSLEDDRGNNDLGARFDEEFDPEGNEEFDEELGLLADYLCGEMSAEERLAFAKRREGDPALDRFAAIMERVWASPTRDEDFNLVLETLRAMDEVDAPEGETEAEADARRALMRETEWDRVKAWLDKEGGRDEAERRRAAPQQPVAKPRMHPWIMSLLAIAYPLVEDIARRFPSWTL